MADLWSECMDDVVKLDTPGLTIDQQLEVVQIKATLSVAQEISRLADRIPDRLG